MFYRQGFEKTSFADIADAVQIAVFCRNADPEPPRDPAPRLPSVFSQFRNWLRAQFEATGHDRQPDALAMHLLSRSQGIAALANAFHHEAVIRHEVDLRGAWLHCFSASRRIGRCHERKSDGGGSRLAKRENFRRAFAGFDFHRVDQSAGRVRVAGSLLLALRGGPGKCRAAADRLDVTRSRSAVKGPEEARLEIRRPDDGLCLHAGHGAGQ